MQYSVSITVTALPSDDYVKQGHHMIHEYGNYIFHDLRQKLNSTMVSKTTSYDKKAVTEVINDEGLVKSKFTYRTEAHDEHSAAALSYDWLCAWNNTHGEKADVEVVPVDASTNKEVSDISFEEVKKRGRPSLKENATES